jgi:hypothetical protein
MQQNLSSSLQLRGVGRAYVKCFVLVTQAGKPENFVVAIDLLSYDFAEDGNPRKWLVLKWSGREDLNLRPPGPEPDSACYGNLLKSVVFN